MKNKNTTAQPLLRASLDAAESPGAGVEARLSVVTAALEGAFTVRETAHAAETLTHLDSADWRLLRSGTDLVSNPVSRDLVAHRRDGDPVVQAGGAEPWPALVGALADGPVHDLIAGPMGVRALIPFATTRAEVVSYAVLNEDAKTVARVHWRDVRLDAPIGHRFPGSVEVEGLRGYAAEQAEVRRRLLRGASMSIAKETWLDQLRALPEIGPEQTRRFGMHRDQAATLAVADALLGYLEVVESTVGGIVDDVDTEFLHDFRVAVRRTRSVLKLLGGVLPTGMADRIGVEFRWLGDRTTPTRDLDVYLLGLADMAASITRPGELDAFGRHLARKRKAEHQKLVRTLRSRRFTDLCAGWRSELGDLLAAPTQPGQTAGQLADQQLHRTYRKVAKRAKAIAADSPSEEVHALRKTCKEMRYVLDVFRPLCNPKAYKRVIEDFKGLQDVLGEFQDGEVQAAALRVFAREMLEAGQVDADAVLAMGELSARFDTQQRAARETLVAHHDDYFGPASAAHVDRLVAS
ncbi:MAG TPA: CHAD domain-containing protein [Propionibacteriaceae bacterium]